MRTPAPPVMSPEEAIADLLSDDAGFTVSEAPEFIEELAKRGYRLAPLARDGETLDKEK